MWDILASAALKISVGVNQGLPPRRRMQQDRCPSRRRALPGSGCGTVPSPSSYFREALSCRHP